MLLFGLNFKSFDLARIKRFVQVVQGENAKNLQENSGFGARLKAGLDFSAGSINIASWPVYHPKRVSLRDRSQNL